MLVLYRGYSHGEYSESQGPTLEELGVRSSWLKLARHALERGGGMGQDPDIGERIKSQRIANGLTQHNLADKLKVSQPTIANWESGRQIPGPERVEAIERIIGPITSNEVEASYERSSIVGQWLSRSLDRKEMTVVELSEKSGVSTATIYNLQNGRAENPRPGTIKKLESALGESLPKEFKEEIQDDSKVQGMGEFLDFNPNDSSEWPSEPGIYVLYDIANRPTYVGQGTNISIRIKDHQSQKWFIPPFVQSASYIKIDDKQQRQNIERLLIKFLKNNAVVNRQNVERD